MHKGQLNIFKVVHKPKLAIIWHIHEATFIINGSENTFTIGIFNRFVE